MILYTKTEALLELAETEVTSLKHYATAEQKAKLSFLDFRANDPEACIYGQMTGNCHSDAACDLIKKCAANMSIDMLQSHWIEENAAAFSDHNRRTNYTPLEIYLFQSDDDTHADIIAFIKGDKTTLELPPPMEFLPDDDLPF